MVKVKNIRTADCVVGGFRYASGSKLIGSLLLGLVLMMPACYITSGSLPLSRRLTSVL